MMDWMKNETTSPVLQNKPVDVENVTWTVVFDDDDQPIACMEQLADGIVMVTTCSDKQFGDILKRLGVGKAPLVREVSHG